METATVETCPPFLTPRESRTLGRTQIYGSPSASLLCVYSGIHTEVKPKGSKPTLANTLHKVRLVNFVFEYEAFSQGEPQCIDFLVGGQVRSSWAEALAGSPGRRAAPLLVPMANRTGPNLPPNVAKTSQNEFGGCLRIPEGPTPLNLRHARAWLPLGAGVHRTFLLSPWGRLCLDLAIVTPAP